MVSCTRLTRRPRPRGPEGSPVDPATKTFLLKTKGTKSQQLGLRGDGGEKGQCREFFTFTKSESEGFFTFTKSESDSSLIFIAVIQSFASVLDEGSMPKVLAMNVSKFTTSLYIAVEEL